MKKFVAVLFAAAVLAAAAGAQSLSVPKLGGFVEISSILGSTNSSGSKITSSLGFDLNAGDFGMVLSWLPSATDMPSDAVTYLLGGSGYDMSPFATMPADFYAWVKLFDGKVKLSAGQINDTTFAAHPFILGGNIVNIISTRDAGQGFVVHYDLMENLKLGLFVPLSDGDNAYKHLSVAAKYTIEGAATFNAGFIGDNKSIGFISVPLWAAFGTVEVSCLDSLALYASYEYLSAYGGKIGTTDVETDNQSEITVGAKYTGIEKLSLAVDTDFAFFDENAFFDSSFGCQIAANAEYALKAPYALGLTAVYNNNALSGVGMSGPPWLIANIGMDNCVMINPYIAINPQGMPPFSKVNLGFKAFFENATGDFSWSVPLTVTVVM